MWKEYKIVKNSLFLDIVLTLVKIDSKWCVMMIYHGIH